MTKSRVAPPKLSLFVVGFGKVGAALASQSQRAGIALVGVQTRSPAHLRAARRLMGGPSAALSSASLVALAVPDSAVAATATALLPQLRRDQVVFHCSGSLSLDGLRQVETRGAQAASWHPYCSIASARSPLKGATCALDGPPPARAKLARLALALGMRPLRKAPSDRIRYHLSAVLTVASAGVAAASAAALLREAGVGHTEARPAIAALLRSVAFNLEHQEAGAALTGPFARADLGRIALQLHALQGHAEALALYRTVGRLSAGLAAHLTEDQRAAVRQALVEPQPFARAKGNGARRSQPKP